MTTPTPEDAVAFPVLTDEQVSVVESFGMQRATRAGEILYREGDTAYDFYVVVSGGIDVSIAASGDEQSIARYGPGQFLGELSLLTGLRAFVTTRVTEGGEVLVLSKEQFRKLIATQSGLSDTILAAYIARRSDPAQRRGGDHSGDRLAVLQGDAAHPRVPLAAQHPA